MDSSLKSQETKSDQYLPHCGSKTEFQRNSKPRTRFSLGTKNVREFSRTEKLLQQRRNNAKLDGGEKQEVEQPRSWLCFAGTGGMLNQRSSIMSQRKNEGYSNPQKRRSEVPPLLPASPLSFAEKSIDEYGFADDMSGVVSRDVSIFTSKTPVVYNGGKKQDILQPIYDRMGLYTKKEKKGLRDALADLLFIRR